MKEAEEIAVALAREHYEYMDLGEEYSKEEIVSDAVDLMLEFYRVTNEQIVRKTDNL